jgi:hypothetical protein
MRLLKLIPSWTMEPSMASLNISISMFSDITIRAGAILTIMAAFALGINADNTCHELPLLGM